MTPRRASTCGGAARRPPCPHPRQPDRREPMGLEPARPGPVNISSMAGTLGAPRVHLLRGRRCGRRSDDAWPGEGTRLTWDPRERRQPRDHAHRGSTPSQASQTAPPASPPASRWAAPQTGRDQRRRPMAALARGQLRHGAVLRSPEDCDRADAHSTRAGSGPAPAPRAKTRMGRGPSRHHIPPTWRSNARSQVPRFHH